ncbi:MAG TPA: MBL fold metallo-hydrolase [Chloroflexota bacterium]|nr:MBL fold metallo-hydrolase [Chloroflexota bacterium]
MVITFLGTAAAEGYPNAFCRCNNCERARALGGPSLRKRSAALINDDLLIDYGPDIMTASFLHGRSLAAVRYCLQTHAHADHLDPGLLQVRNPEWGVVGAPRLHFYASAASVQRLARMLDADFSPGSGLDPRVGERLNVEIHRVAALQSFAAGPYRVTAFPANHDPAVAPLLYAIEGEGRTIFYGTDTAALPEETWSAFHRHRLRFDTVILDHTYGAATSASDHLNAQQFVEHVARLRDEGRLTAQARVFATHLSPETNPPHPDLVTIAMRQGYEVAYDGLTV